jgi:hypothetical protein
MQNMFDFPPTPTGGVVLLYYGVAGLVTGTALSVVFQVAHCVEAAEFPVPRASTGRIDHAWAVHQAETTVDFARRSRLVTWLVGGLNNDFGDSVAARGRGIQGEREE